MGKQKSIYTLREPCSNCPFRSDKPFYLGAERAEGIADDLHEGKTFYCHKTIDYDVEPEYDENGCEVDGPDSQIGSRARACAGALITMEKSGEQSFIMQIAQRFGLYEPKHLNMDAPVYGSLKEWVESYKRFEGKIK